jgi:hypothetical protein
MSAARGKQWMETKARFRGWNWFGVSVKSGSPGVVEFSRPVTR